MIVALADKIDSLAAFFAIDEKPTGSRDPFALRRAALGTIRLILENGLRLPLFGAFSKATSAFDSYDTTLDRELLGFITDRLKVHLRDEGVRHDHIAAVCRIAGFNDDDLVRMLARVNALQKFLNTDDGANLLVAYRRASNIVAIEERNGGWTLGSVNLDLLTESAERHLARDLEANLETAYDAVSDENFEGAMAALAALRRPVDEFFDKVTVNTDAEEGRLRENRLRLLSRIRAVMNQVADFSQIEG